jgi:outer membrane lipoprotein-sorting protein
MSDCIACKTLRGNRSLMIVKKWLVRWCCVWVVGCAGPIPLPQHLTLSEPSELSKRVAEAGAKVHGYIAEARLTYFNDGTRLRGSAQVAVQRPHQFRVDILAPHGGVLEAFASDGEQLQWLDNHRQVFFNGPATARAMSQLKSMTPISIGSSSWTELLLGEIKIPPEATTQYDAQRGRFIVKWRESEKLFEVVVEPESSWVEAVHVTDAVGVGSEINIHDRDDRGIPISLTVLSQNGQSSLRIHLRDIQVSSKPIAPSVFRLRAPRGMKTVTWGP